MDMHSIKDSIRNVDTKTMLSTGFLLMRQTKIALCVVCLFSLVYIIGYESVFKPMMAGVTMRENAVNTQKAALEQKEREKELYDRWKREVSTLNTEMIELEPEQFARVIAIKESEKITTLAKRTADETELPPPHNKREAVALESTANSKVDLIKAKKEDNPQGGDIILEALTQSGYSMDLPLEKFDYKMVMSGTYPAIVDFINKLSTLDTLVALTEINITPASATAIPDPEKFPDYPVKVNLELNFSIYLYAPNNQYAATEATDGQPPEDR